MVTKKDYNINHFTPVLSINKRYEPFTHQQVKTWLEKHQDYITNSIGQFEYNFLHTFSENDLNFGRHVFKSISHGMNNLKHDYIEALMDHNNFGTNAHGKYTIFKKQDYLNKTRETLHYIQNEYIPYLKWINE